MHRVGALREDFYRKGLKWGGGTLMNIGIVSCERHGYMQTYCSRAARERGLPLRLPGSERHAVVLAGARGYTCVGSRQKSRTHSRLQTMDRRARRHEWSTGILDRQGGEWEGEFEPRTSNKPEYRAVSGAGSADLIARHETPWESSSWQWFPPGSARRAACTERKKTGWGRDELDDSRRKLLPP